MLVSLEALARRNLGKIDFRHVQANHHRSGGNRHLLEFQGIGRSIIRLDISIVGYLKFQILWKMKDNAVQSELSCCRIEVQDHVTGSDDVLYVNDFLRHGLIDCNR